jgi:hypothetical protein
MLQQTNKKGELIMDKPKHFAHGEVNLFEVPIPKSAKKVEVKSEDVCEAGIIIGESESTGNHHCIEADPEKVDVFMDGEQMYLNVKEPAKIACLHPGRHDTIVLPVGTYKRNIAKEFDYLADAKRNVAD